MTYYTGGKKRIGSDIANKIVDLTFTDKKINIKGYCEPFCGMMGVYNHIPELIQDITDKKIKYKAGDRNPYIIKLWNALKEGWKPPSKCSRKEYYGYKDKNSDSVKSIFIGYACSFLGIFRNTYMESRNIPIQRDECMRIGKILNDNNVELTCGEYTIYSNLKGYIIYCDPPYKGTQNTYLIGSKFNNTFDYDKFITWCNNMSVNNIVFISEYTKPCKNSKMVYSNGKEKLYLII